MTLKMKLAKKIYGEWLKDPRAKPPVKDYTPDDLSLQNYKEPLRPVEKGYGYMGTLALTKDGEFVQCHICGLLFRSLPFHIYNAHGIKSREYKDKFGLMYTNSLMAENLRMEYKQKSLEYFKSLTDEQKEEIRRRSKEAVRAFGAEKRARSGQPVGQLEAKNKRGTCPDQLLFKIMEIAKDLGHTPSKREFVMMTGTQKYIHRIYKTFGSWEEALNIVGMQPKVSKGRQPQYSLEQLLELLRTYTKQYGVVPTCSDFSKGILPSYDLYLLRFGGIESARKQAGVYDLLPTKGLSTNTKKYVRRRKQQKHGEQLSVTEGR